MFVRLVVNESIVRVIGLSKEGSTAIGKMCEELEKILHDITENPGSWSEMMVAASAEVSVVVKSLRMLLGSEQPDASVLDELTGAKGGCKQMVKNGVATPGFLPRG